MKNNHDKQWGEFCQIFGATPRNRILEFFLDLRELDHSIGDVARETGLNRATAYNTMRKLVKSRYIKPARKVSGSQLYKLTMEKAEVKVMVQAYSLILKKIANEYQEMHTILKPQIIKAAYS
ncbi:helix-turn-helix transcriptional regulator [Candidatus Woesearchaeota archaeon]|nr:helix-turn-helix transcriptional regulator [Candidatus Woesearchaeota archaeon]